MFLFGLKARRQIGLLLRNPLSREKFQSLFGVDGFPHGDTVDTLFRNLNPEQLQEVVTSMTEILIRKKVLYPWRLFGRFFVVAIDATGYRYFKERHCPYCLSQTREEKTIYYHMVLEAKLVTWGGFAFSLMSEFIENSDPATTKQDCELKAFYRLAPRLKSRLPHLPVVLSLDGLFANGPVFSLLKKYGWGFVITLKDDSLRSVHEEFEGLCKLQSENRLAVRMGKEAEIEQAYRWATDISYIDTERREHTLSMIECKETKPAKNKGRSLTTFKWVTDFTVAEKTVQELAHNGGRTRWKVENQGFKNQKCGGYALEHQYSTDPTSTKNFYFMLQIAHMLIQLMEKGSLLKKHFPKGFGSTKNLVLRLLEAWRCARLSVEEINALEHMRRQIRFNTS